MPDLQSAELADVHNHLVPGVDDGARSIAEAVRHLRALRAEGVARLGVSPHLNGTAVWETGAFYDRLAQLEAAFRTLTDACAKYDDVPVLHFGQEILIPDAETARRALAEPRLGIRGTRYVLMELGFRLGEDTAGTVRAAAGSGRIPIVAHPERYVRDGGRVPIDEIRSWREAGALLQVNGGSVLGDYGEEIRRLAWRLIEEGLADLIATDHHADSRVVSPAAVGRALAARGAGEQARLLLAENPTRILDDRETLAVPGRREQAAA